MTYLEKEQQLIQRLNETNYEQFDDKNDALTFLEEQLTAFFGLCKCNNQRTSHDANLESQI